MISELVFKINFRIGHSLMNYLFIFLEYKYIKIIYRAGQDTH